MLILHPSVTGSQLPVLLNAPIALPASVKAAGGELKASAIDCTKLIAHLTKERSFTSADFAMFTKFRWSLQLVEQSGITRVTADAARDIHQIQCSGDVGGLLYPYCDRLNDDAPLMARFRPDDDPETGKAPDLSRAE